MSLLVVGLSHRSAPVSVLERAALSLDAQIKLLQDTVAAEPTAEAAVLATCNRIELYADVDKFHAGVAELSTLLAQHSGVGLDEITPYLYVHYEDRAVHHLFSVACGLDSMVVGEGQILGQIKDALARAQEMHTAGRLLNDLFQQSLQGRQAGALRDRDRPGRAVAGDVRAGAVHRRRGRRGLGPGQAGRRDRRRVDVLAGRRDPRARGRGRDRDRQPDVRPGRATRTDPGRTGRNGRAGPRGTDGIGAGRADTCRCRRLLYGRHGPGPERRDDRGGRRGPGSRGRVRHRGGDAHGRTAGPAADLSRQRRRLPPGPARRAGRRLLRARGRRGGRDGRGHAGAARGLGGQRDRGPAREPSYAGA